jgi:hypothetical protein
MLTDVGEYIVGAYLRLILNCDFVDYNVRAPGGGLQGLDELDVLGLDFRRKRCYLCEVTTHIRGVLYRNNQETVRRITRKYEYQRRYAREHLPRFKHAQFMFWSPVVPRGYITDRLERLTGLELFINGRYKQAVEQVRQIAREVTYDARNPFFRVLQILEHMRD